MRSPTPICLLVDDPCPLIHVYREHWRDVHKKPPETEDGRPLAEVIPNDFLDRYCDVMERWGIKGKFSIVPAPAGKGDIVSGIEGYDPALTRSWLDTVKRRLSPLCDFCPEGITHNLAVDLDAATRRHGDEAKSGVAPSPPRRVPASEFVFLPESENEWSQKQNRDKLTPYLAYSLQLMKEAGFDCTGVTSPWVFGIRVETEYTASIVAAQKAVYGRDFSWYFLHMMWGRPSVRPWIAFKQDRFTLVSIAANVNDHWWATINSPRTDAEWIEGIVDKMLTADGRRGEIAEVLEAGGWPILCTHWQSLFSNGLESGLAALDLLGRRIREVLGSRVQWMTCSEIAELTASAS